MIWKESGVIFLNNKKLFVGSLPWSVNDDQLKQIFSQAGNVVSAQVVKDRDSGRSKGFGFVEMSTEEEAENAVKNLNSSEVEGRKIFVSIARPKDN